MLGIGGWDWFALGLYLVGITALGVWTARKVKDTADFFIGGRRFGKTFMVFFSFGAGTNGNQAVGVAAKTYTDGLSGIWYQWLWLFATPFYWIIAPFFRRMRALTTGDFYEYRYDRSTAALYSLVGVLQLTVNIGVMLKGSGAVIEAISGGAIKQEWAIPLMTLLFVIYGIAGGLGAAIVTDFIQGILTVLLSFMVLPFALKAVGGFTGLHASIADKSMLSLVAPGEINGFHIVMLATNALIGIVTQPHIMGVCAAGRNEMDGRVGFAGGNLLKRFCTVAWMLTGLCAVVKYRDLAGEKVDLVYGMMAYDLLPEVAPGLIGIFLAALLASVMSLAMLHGFLLRSFHPEFLSSLPGAGPQRAALCECRAPGLPGGCGDCPCFRLPVGECGQRSRDLLENRSDDGGRFWLGLFWRRANVAGAWVGT